LWTQAVDRFAQKVAALAPPAGFFRGGTPVHKYLRNRLPAIVRAVWQDFETSPPFPQYHEGFIHGDACQPGGKLRLFLEGVEMKEGLVKALLRDIFSILAVFRYALRHGKNSLLVARNQFLEYLRIPNLCGSHQLDVGDFVDVARAKRVHDPEPP